MESRNHMALMSPVITKVVSLDEVAACKTVVSRVLGKVLENMQARRLWFKAVSLDATVWMWASTAEETKRRAVGLLF